MPLIFSDYQIEVISNTVFMILMKHFHGISVQLLHNLHVSSLTAQNIKYTYHQQEHPGQEKNIKVKSKFKGIWKFCLPGVAIFVLYVLGNHYAFGSSSMMWLTLKQLSHFFPKYDFIF